MAGGGLGGVCHSSCDLLQGLWATSSCGHPIVPASPDGRKLCHPRAQVPRGGVEGRPLRGPLETEGEAPPACGVCISSHQPFGLWRQRRTQSKLPAGLRHAVWPWRHPVTSLSLVWLSLLIIQATSKYRSSSYVPGARPGRGRGQSVHPGGSWVGSPWVQVGSCTSSLTSWSHEVGRGLGNSREFGRSQNPLPAGPVTPPGAACHPTAPWCHQPGRGRGNASPAVTASATKAATAPPPPAAFAPAAAAARFQANVLLN